MKALTLLALSSLLILTSCASNESKRQAELLNLELMEVAGDLQDRPVMIGEKASGDILLEDNSARKNNKNSIISTNTGTTTVIKE